MVYTRAMRNVLPVFLALVLVACKTDLAWQGSPNAPSGPAYLETYKESYFLGLGNHFSGSWSRAELLRALPETRVLYLGDHHEDHALHRRQLRLLQQMRDAGLRPALGLEAVGTQDQEAVDRFLEGGNLDELRLGLRRRWSGSWLESRQIDGAFYGALLEQARADRWPVFALEPTPRLPLPERDRVIAANIRRANDHHPDRLLVVVVGQAHLLGEGKLMERVDLPHIAIGAEPSPQLARSPTGRRVPDTFLRSSSGVLFFEGMVPRQ